MDYVGSAVEALQGLKGKAEPYLISAWDSSPQIVKTTWDAIVLLYEQHPGHFIIEIIFAGIIIYFIFLQPRRRAKPDSLRPSREEQEMLLKEWSSEPFSPSPLAITNAQNHTPYVIERWEGPFAYAKLTPNAKEKKVLNLASYDFLSYATDPRILEVAKATIRAWGVGSCGPRGFYGSLKPHLDLEADLAKFLDVHSAIIYSFQFATTSTLIPCFSARQDTILCDAGVNLVVQKGCTLARSAVTYYRHNDLSHLEQLMNQCIENDKKARRKLFRRFVVTEGLFRNSGDICPLPDILELCEKYKFRLILDDSYGFGVLGHTGRGTPEHFSVAQDRIAIYIGSLSTSLGAVGGFCAGTNNVVDHQRLGATGYVYSASLPPYVTCSASKALHLIDEEPQRVRRLQHNAKVFRKFFSDPTKLPRGVVMRPCLNDVSPLIHFVTTAGAASGTFEPQEDKCFETAAHILAHRHSILGCRAFCNGEEKVKFPASLRLTLRSELTEKQVLDACQSISEALFEGFA